MSGKRITLRRLSLKVTSNRLKISLRPRRLKPTPRRGENPMVALNDISEIFTLFPSRWSFELKRNNRGGVFSMQGNVRKGYSAHWKSFGLGMGRPVIFALGCFFLASSSSTTGSYPTKASPSATMAYFPECLSTNSPRCRRIHSGLLTFLIDSCNRTNRFRKKHYTCYND